MIVLSKKVCGSDVIIIGNTVIVDENIYNIYEAQSKITGITEEYMKNKESPEDFDSLVVSSDWRLRCAAAIEGEYRHRLALLNDEVMTIKCNIIVNSDSEDCHPYIDDEDWYVRSLVARYGDYNARSELLNDPVELVRQAVARYGHNDHRYRLLDDTSSKVRAYVAIYGDTPIRDILSNDGDLLVLKAVYDYGNHYHKEKLKPILESTK